MFSRLWQFLNSTTLFPLVIKETQQMLRNKQLLFMLIFTPTFQLWLFCSALDPEPKHIRMSIYDSSATPASRNLIDILAHTNVFDVDKGVNSEKDALQKMKMGKSDVAVLIPPKFNTYVKAHKRSPVQVAIDGVDANTAGIVAAYFSQAFTIFNQQLQGL